MSRISALPCSAVVRMPAWDPVKLTAGTSRASIAIATSAIEIRSPAVRSMSISRGCGASEIWVARSINPSVDFPIAETTTTTSLPAWYVSTTRRATFLIRSASASDVPPNFCTTSAMWTMSVGADGRTSVPPGGMVPTIPRADGRVCEVENPGYANPPIPRADDRAYEVENPGYAYPGPRRRDNVNVLR